MRKQWKQWQLYILGLQNSYRWWLQPWNEKPLAPWKKSYDKLQFSLVIQLCLTQQQMELAPTHVHEVSDAIQPSYPLLSPSPPALNLSQHQGLFKWVRTLHQLAKYWSFSFNISPSNKYSGLISFRIDWFDFLVVQWTLKSLLQYHSSKASIFQYSAFFLVQLSYPLHDYWKNQSFD